MASLYDVARFITEELGELTAMKLQKLMFYSQAWHLVWEETPLFNDDFQAWANGPVLPALYERHRNRFKVDSSLFADGDASHLMTDEIVSIRKVLGFYGDKSAQWLSNLTHQEAPWLDARLDLTPGERSTNPISQAAIFEYYSSL